MLALMFLWFLAGPRVELVDEVYQIPAREWRYIEVGLNRQTALVSARYECVGGSRTVRLALLRRADLERLRLGAPHGAMEVLEAAPRGELSYAVPAKGDYALVIDNPAAAPAAVHLSVWLDFGRPGAATAQITAPRRRAVVLISFAAFFAIVSFSARKLLRIARK